MDNRYNPMFPRLIHVFFIGVSILMIAPMILIVSISVTSEASLVNSGYGFIPQEINLDAYRVIFEVPEPIIRAYVITAARTIIGTWLSLLLIAVTGYVISRPKFRYGRILVLLIFFTILFKPGLVPSYILISQHLRLRDTVAVLIIPALFNPFFVLVMRGFIRSSVPEEVIESAKLDGASEFRIFLQIVLPLSTPALATLGVLIAFFYWNEWWLALLYIDNPDLAPLQLLLYRIQNRVDFISANPELAVELGIQQLPSLSLRMAMVVVAAGPMMFVFPLFRRFFVRGISVGSFK